MNPFTLLRTEIIRRPIFNILLVLLMAFGGNLWWAIIVLTLFVRIALRYFWANPAAMQWQMAGMQPKMKEIQDKYADDPQRMSQEMMKIWKDTWWWPLKGCIGMLMQLPVFLGLFYTIQELALGTISILPYSFLAHLNVDLSALQTNFYGLDLLTANNIILAVIAGILMVWQMKLTTAFKPAAKTPDLSALWGKDMPDMSKMMWSMSYIMALMMWWFVFTMPAGVGLYIVTTTLFGIFQSAHTNRPMILVKLRALSGKKPKPEIIEG